MFCDEVLLNLCDSHAARRMNTWVISWRRSNSSKRRPSTTSRLGSTATRVTQTLVRVVYVDWMTLSDIWINSENDGNDRWLSE